MEIIYVVLIILLLAATTDLMVGVANDAVNFLNSAIGAKVASRLVIMIVATAGIVVGVTFASGLMEVARKGIFNPGMLTFNEVMFIFVATMLTDVLLLDFFNTFGLPTSTTVSLVFELLGASFAVSLIKVMVAGDGGVAEALAFINTASVLKIIFGIVLSVLVAFIVGSIIQYFSRMLFTFEVEKRLKRYGAVWGGFALAVLSYFIMVKGAKGASFLTDDQGMWLRDNALLLSLFSFALWAFVMQMLNWFTKVNILKPIVLAGTFALAMAFAANDLVNFIGAPLAGLAAFEHAKGAAEPFSMTMEVLAEPVRANTWILLIAGGIMAMTLLLSKKARTVTATSVNLGRQSEGYERFESNAAARSVVRLVLAIIKLFSLVTPESVKQWVEARFDTSKYKPVPDENGEVPSFDMLRAAVNLIVAALLISFGTTLKLPLSTTYVTFMVAMATALPDRAWGRDSAVYRVSGVLTVIGGWFFTAIIAATAAGLVATIVYFTELVGLLILGGLGAFLMINSVRTHRKREKEFADEERLVNGTANNIKEAMDNLLSDIGEMISSTSEIMRETSEYLIEENRLELRRLRDMSKQLNKRSKNLSSTIIKASQFEEGEEAVEAKTYAEIMGSLQLLARSLRNMTLQSYTHVDNNHKNLSPAQIEDMHAILPRLCAQLQVISTSLIQRDFSGMETIFNEADELRDMIRKADKQQLKRSKKDKYTTRTSLLFLEILTEYEEILYHSRMLYDRCRNCQTGAPSLEQNQAPNNTDHRDVQNQSETSPDTEHSDTT